ncbi:hypothetical protein [Flavobacterium stagni]|uniref:DUF3592 domain-containing protein n=1 Tax=Flavobacterium stagni TaxID=2506421 RepID=A0A4Q1K3B9_9FLAO|nr:hypothetical protein [Flavobacterium stagni]RXR18881.1 hypothetical protein EQG61_13565 [Flavobacterium stagni]
MQSRRNEISKKMRKFKNRVIIICVLSPILYLILNIAKWPIFNFLLDNYSKVTTGVIIDEKNFIGKGVIIQMYSYSYEFYAENESYIEDSRNQKCKVGEKVEIEYLECCPSISRLKQ